MARLNQILGVENSAKTRYHELTTAVYHLLQKSELFQGVSRKYRPKEDGGEQLSDEDKAVTHRASQVIAETTAKMTEIFDISAMRDYTNCKAKADVVVDGKVLIKDAPATYLLFLSKRLDDLHAFVKKIPTLPAGEEWEMNPAQDLWATKPVESTRTKKVSRPLILAEATKEHPAQVKEVTEDVVAGYWVTTKYSSALPVARINVLVARVEELQRAVKFAREKANEIDCEDVKVGKALIDFIFAP